ncbi:MAG: hypothetical protein Q7S44_00135 [bacterium]|nr:hypothetical protein [bacterium]
MSREQNEGGVVVIIVDPDMVNGYAGEVLLQAEQVPKSPKVVELSKLPQAKKTPPYLG